MNFLEFAQENAITLESKYVDMVPDPWGDGGDTKRKYFQWLCTLTKMGDYVSVYSSDYYTGPGNAEYWYRGEKSTGYMERKYKGKCLPDSRYYKENRSMWTTDRFMLPHPPKVEDLLYSLQSDCAAGQILLFDEFCSDFGYDEDSRKAEHMWRKCQTVCGELQRFYAACFGEFMECRED